MSSNRKRLSTLILVFSFLLILIPLLTFTLIATVRVNRVVSNQTLLSAQQVLDTTATALSSLITSSSKVIDAITMDSLIYEVASFETGKLNTIEQLKMVKRLKDSFYLLQKVSLVDSISIYVLNDIQFTGTDNNIYNLLEHKNTLWYKSLINSGTNELWLFPKNVDDEFYSVFRKLDDPATLAGPLAILRIDIKKEAINSLLLDGNSTNTSSISIKENIQETNPSSKWIKSEGFYTINRKLTPSPWGLVTKIPEKEIKKIGFQLMIELILLMFFLTILIYSVLLIASHDSMKRLDLLTKGMNQIREGNFNVHVLENKKGFLRHLVENFNAMVRQLENLMNEKYRMGLMLKNFELKALQAQINPHFLYNTLDLINCKAIECGAPEIVQTVQALAGFYRISLNKGQEYLSLEEEIQHTRLYLKIQNLRFENRIQINEIIEKETLDCRVMKIILQPIIENSIIHGIFEKPNKTGMIDIETKRCGENLFITISDDGVGMKEEQVSALFDSHKKETDGYGLSNIQDRIKLAYGNEFGMLCTSEIGQGTIITMKLPFLHN